MSSSTAQDDIQAMIEKCVACVCKGQNEMRTMLLDNPHDGIRPAERERFLAEYQTLVHMRQQLDEDAIIDDEERQARALVSHAFFLERSYELKPFAITCDCISSLPWTMFAETMRRARKTNFPPSIPDQTRWDLLDILEKIELVSIIHSGMQADSLPEEKRMDIVVTYDELSPLFKPASSAAYSGIGQAFPPLLTALERAKQGLSVFSLEDLRSWAGNGSIERYGPLRFPDPAVGWDTVRTVLKCSLKSYNKLAEICTTQSPNRPVESQSGDLSTLQYTHDALVDELSNGINAAIVRLVRCAQKAHSLVRDASTVFIRNGIPEICCTCGVTEDVSAVTLLPAARS
ncbi:MAG: hypothetical protein TREMPRED_005067 [Tremellales sp. Tagirdzhanova-0007]|nr:MAG: hypothetical protein TREMPRED_005067 [Tremellales sp. Tagirdzhanova-0007]